MAGDVREDDGIVVLRVPGGVHEREAALPPDVRVLTKAGAPIEDANVWARSTRGGARDKTGWGGDTSKRDGTYAMKGLKPGSYKIEVTSEAGNGPVEGQIRAHVVTAAC